MPLQEMGGLCMRIFSSPLKLTIDPSPPFFTTVIVLRALCALLATIALQAIFPLGTPSLFIALACIFGVVGGSFLAQSSLSTIGCISVLAALCIAHGLGIWLTEVVLGTLGSTSFILDRLSMHSWTCLACLTVWALATWVFWRVRSALTFEVLAFFITVLTLFAGHRQFHLDRPKILNTVAWKLGVDHVTMLVLIGASLVALALSYFYCASMAIRPRPDGRVQRMPHATPSITSVAILILFVGAVLYGIQTLVHRYYSETMLARVANGVGMNNSAGVSPLSFQSALGSTNQPAALVRLEGDYGDNPFTPMLYLRESALSSFNGREMVFAGRAYDTDLPAITSRDTFTRQEDAELGERTPLVQSVYLLADHDQAFAADYPISIVQLKNPRPNRFKATYRAYSVAPAYTVSTLTQRRVGDSRWTPDIERHYLTPHPDTRYSELAQKVTQDAVSPVEKLNALTSYLSKNSIYTLTPNHDIKPTDDPVAAFLFGDHRGYCVHFAHAVVFMARSLGIPARIGTGYLTDLSQAKDGHILLRMSDRHAWAEAFITGIGWVPFDVQPEQVESHAETQVDAKLLEELMGALEPGEEILPTEQLRDEPGMSEPTEHWIPSRQQVAWILLTCLLGIFTTKVVLRNRWRIAPTSRLKLQWGYIGIASMLHDIGITRAFGETREEFAARTPDEMMGQLSRLLVQATYSRHTSPNNAEIHEAIHAALGRYRTLPLRVRILSAMSPRSVARATSTFFLGRDW